MSLDELALAENECTYRYSFDLFSIKQNQPQDR